MSEVVLCLNAGSSSIKFQLFEDAGGGALDLRLKGQLEGIGVKPRLVAQDSAGQPLAERLFERTGIPEPGAAVPKLLDWLDAHLDGAKPTVIAHRVVTGGTRHAAPVAIDAEVLEHLRGLVSFMPLHLPSELAAIERTREALPGIPHVAVFDTAFHRGHEPVIERFAIPDAFHEAGLRRYGYHGISYEYIATQLPTVAPAVAAGKVVVAHLGSGCSMCALVDGRSVETSMGFSTLDGLPMGTRPGRLDPGAVLYLLQNRGMSVSEVETLLYQDCGLKGLSGISNDVRELLASPDQRARLALDYLYLHCARMVAELAVVMGGIDALVFTAGVGENAAPVRAGIAARLSWLGLEIDAAANAAHGPCISTRHSRIDCYVIPTNEELMMARHAVAVVQAHAAGVQPGR